MITLDILDDVRVIELATGIAGPYAGKLFADAGADVIKIEPPGGDPLRRRSASGSDLGGRDSALFRFLNAGKRSVVAEPEDPEVEALVAGANLVIESFVPGRPVVEAWQRHHRNLVLLSTTPFGRSGPWRDRPANGFTIQAESGSIGARGRRDDVPFQAGARTGEWCAGVFGAVGALAAVLRALATGIGEHVDSPWLVADHLSTNPNMSLRHSLLGRPPLDQPARVVDAPSIEPTKDGFVGLNTNTRQQLEDFLRMIDRTDLLADERWASAEFRMTHIDDWNTFVEPWMRQRTTDEVMDTAALWRIPVAPVNNGKTLLEQEHYRVRGVFAPAPDGEFIQPVTPYLIDGERPKPHGPAPDLGRDTGRVEQREHPGHGAAQPNELPFVGIRVLDVTSMWAGPVVGQVLAALGADVIHLESVQRVDLGRLKVDAAYGSPQWWERAPNWLMVNPNKRDLTLDLRDPRGRELAEALIAQSDVLVENFSPRVFEHFGLTAARVRELNPAIVFARMPAFGLDGPWRDHVGFAQTMEQVSGLAWVTGHRHEPAPRVPRGPCDPLAGYHALFSIMVGLRRRQRSSAGAFLELAMTESALNAAAEILLEYSASGAILERNGNRSCDAAPQGVYRCRGDERWLALSIETDEQWEAAKGVLGHPVWADGLGLATSEGRRAAHDTLDDELAQWARKEDLDSVVERFIAAGVPAAVVRDPRVSDQHPQMSGWGYFETTDHPVVGRHPLPGLPFHYRTVERWFRTAAPLLGQHNEEILCDLLHLAPSEIRQLEEQGVIGRTPLGSNPSFDL